MSVSSIYLAVQWQPFLQAAEQSSPEEGLDAAEENEEPWVRTFPFGKKVDRYIFESRNAVSEFDDWFREVRRRLNPESPPPAGSNQRIDLDADLIALARAKLKGFFGSALKRSPVTAAQRKAAESFQTLFLDFGLIHEDSTLKLKPINRTVDAPGEWLIATMSPDDVRLLNDRAAGINHQELTAWFDAALALKPCHLVENGKTPVAWIGALKAGLEDTVRKGEGIAFGMA